MTREKVTNIRPRRSALYMPSSNARALEKAKTLASDVIIFDLEDAVAPEAKNEARIQLAEALTGGGYGNRECVVRVNAIDTPWGADDLDMVRALKPDAVLIPKVSRPQDIENIQSLCASDTQIWIMIETPEAIFNLSALAACAATSNLTCFIMGTNDLLKDMQARALPARDNLQAALSLSVLAARQHGLMVLDGVFNDIEDQEGLAAECRQGLAFGFDGKTLIHPSQLSVANEIFAPSADEVSQARAVIAAFDDPANAGKGVLRVNGRMTELLHRDSAIQLIAVFEAVQRGEGS